MTVNKIHDQRGNRSKQNTWDEKTAEWYTAEYGEHISNNLTISNIDLVSEDIVLDIGCGSGKAARLAAKICTNGKVIGGLYSYSIKILDFKDKPFIYTGLVNLIR